MDIQNSNQNLSSEQASAVTGSEALPADTLEGELQAALSARDRLAAEKAELADRLLRLHADFDNFRRRAEQKQADFVQYAAADLVASLLPTLDDFERAMRHETTDAEYAKGVDLIYQGLWEALKKVGLEPIETAGKRFDPSMHQAVQRVETDAAEDQAILDEFQKGYNFRGKLLRPAMVKVAVRP